LAFSINKIKIRKKKKGRKEKKKKTGLVSCLKIDSKLIVD
jgi:hypothetical protein